MNRGRRSVRDFYALRGARVLSWNILLLRTSRDQREDSGGDRSGAAFKQV